MIKTVRSTILFAALLLSWSGSMAQPVEYEEGVHFSELQIPIRTRNPDKIEVAEYFSYGCPHCFEFEPLISAWHRNLPEDVEFIRTPAIWNEDYQVYAQTYYTIQALKVVDVVHTPIFNAIHNLRARLNSPQQMAGFLKDFGVAPEAFAKAYNSFGVRAGVQQAIPGVKLIAQAVCQRLLSMVSIELKAGWLVAIRICCGWPIT